jgi:DNA-binding NarL/FixJ family response regulator
MVSTKISVPKPISVVIFDVTGITSDLLQRAFVEHPEFMVVGCPKSIEEALRLAIEKQPDAIIISAFESKGSLIAIELLDGLTLIGSTARAVILSASLTDREVIAYFRAQARGLLSGGSADFASLCKCVTCVHSGQIWANSEQLLCLVQSLAQPKACRIMDAKGIPILTEREHEVLHFLAEGMTNRDIASLLKLSEHTVKNHVFHIFDKLGVSSRMEAVVYSFNHLEAPVRSARRPLAAVKISARLAIGLIALMSSLSCPIRSTFPPRPTFVRYRSCLSSFRSKSEGLNTV